jgi:hypothetical protein
MMAREVKKMRSPSINPKRGDRFSGGGTARMWCSPYLLQSYENAGVGVRVAIKVWLRKEQYFTLLPAIALSSNL